MRGPHIIIRMLAAAGISLLTSAATLDAQLVRSYGVKLGGASACQSFEYTAASIVQSSDLDLKRRTGFGAAAYCEWFRLPVISVVTQAEYRQGGVGMNYLHIGPNGEDLGTITEHTRIDYLSLAALVKARTSGSLARPYVMAGLRRDRMVGVGVGLSHELFRQFEKDVAGASFGAGLEFLLVRQMTVLIEARHDVDLSDAYHGEFLRVRNNSTSLWLGVGF